MRILSIIGIVLLTALKWLAKLVIGAFIVALEAVKILLLMLGLVMRVFLVFVSVGTS